MNVKVEHFDFLTEQRQQAIRIAIDAANRQQDEMLRNKAHLYENMNPFSKAHLVRGWLIAHAIDALSNDEEVVRHLVNNIDGLQFDDSYFVYFRKVGDPEIPPGESKTLAKARHEKTRSLLLADLLAEEECQLPLFPELMPEESGKIPLGDLHHIVAGYSTDKDGRVVALHFLDVNYDVNYGTGEILDSYELDLTISFVPRQQEAQRPPETIFTAKSDIAIKEENTA